jgi:hypothetical protein
MQAHDCQKRDGLTVLPPVNYGASPDINGAGIDRTKLRESPGRPKGARNLHAKHPSSLAKRLKLHGVDWVQQLATAIKAAGNMDYKLALRAQARDDVRMWLRALPYLVTTTNTVKVRKWKGKASKAALAALNALEGR